MSHEEGRAIANPEMALEKTCIHTLVRIGKVQHRIEPEPKGQPGAMKNSACKRRNKCTAAIQYILLALSAVPAPDAATLVTREALAEPCVHHMFKTSIF
ncbi:MAG: hypothetical protein C0496_11185 [Erythrobacter sp.]|nr:hypothetical protein [Erythrobacter sp.]